LSNKTEETMKELAERLGPSLIPLKIGTTMEVEVTSVSRNRILVNVKDLGIGLIPEKEFSGEGIEVKPKDKILASILNLENQDGYIILSLKRADKERIWQNLKEKMEANESINVKVLDANRGGLIVQFGSLEGFLPVSQLSPNLYSQSAKSDTSQLIYDLKKLVNKILDVKIINIDSANNKLIFSEKEVSQANRKEKIKEMFKVGQRIKGKITGIVPFGLFVNLGEIEGLIHISEISWERVSDLHKDYKIGQEVESEIIDLENGKISLSIKKLISDPWTKTAEKYQKDSVIQGKVLKLTPFGALIELEDKINGLVHISELTNKMKEMKNTKIEDMLEIGKNYQFKILEVDQSSHKINLSLFEDEKKDKAKKVTKNAKKKPAKNEK